MNSGEVELIRKLRENAINTIDLIEQLQERVTLQSEQIEMQATRISELESKLGLDTKTSNNNSCEPYDWSIYVS
jgi:uncharacterized protein YigA (DUF484 family)